MPKGFSGIHFLRSKQGSSAYLKGSSAYHLFFGLLDLVALVVAFYYPLDAIPFFFSYFTVLSNILVTFVFLCFGLGSVKNKLVNKLYGPSTLYMAITGVVFWTILRNDHAISTIPWITMVMHAVMPIIVVFGWILYPAKLKTNYKTSLKWLIFPLLFVGYTLIRGPIVKWYPYPFLNPEKVGGYGGVALYVLFILLGAWIASLILLWIQKIRKS